MRVDPVSNNKHQLEIMEMARKEGLDPANLSVSQYRRLSFKVRSTEEKIVDVKNALLSRVLTSVGLRTVSLEQARQNEAVCKSNKCGKFSVLEGKHPVCGECNCAGKFLESKWRDASEACPLGNWTNIPIGETQPRQDGDMVRNGQR